MSEMQAYLDRHYCEASVIADRCGISVAELDELVARRLVPGPSYVVMPEKIISAAFGDLSQDGAVPGRYFAPSQSAWVAAAGKSRDDPGEIARIFRDRMTVALAEANRSIFRLPDAFDEDCDPTSGIDARLDNLWTNFIAGVFALCVADAASERSIARKEVLQEKLVALTSNGASINIDGLSHSELSDLMDDYAAAAMPFAPSEYPRSSRKRLVDDLRSKLSRQSDQPR